MILVRPTCRQQGGSGRRMVQAERTRAGRRRQTGRKAPPLHPKKLTSSCLAARSRRKLNDTGLPANRCWTPAPPQTLNPKHTRMMSMMRGTQVESAGEVMRYRYLPTTFTATSCEVRGQRRIGTGGRGAGGGSGNLHRRDPRTLAQAWPLCQSARRSCVMPGARNAGPAPPHHHGHPVALQVQADGGAHALAAHRARTKLHKAEPLAGGHHAQVLAAPALQAVHRRAGGVLQSRQRVRQLGLAHAGWVGQAQLLQRRAGLPRGQQASPARAPLPPCPHAPPCCPPSSRTPSCRSGSGSSTSGGPAR